MIGRKRDVRSGRLAHRLAVLPALGDRELDEVLLDRIRDPVGTRERSVDDVSAQAVFAACAASSASSTSPGVERGTSVKTSPVTGVRFSLYSHRSARSSAHR